MRRNAGFLLILLFLCALYGCTAMGRAILDDGDALYATVAQEMVVRNDWVTPYADGVRFLDKPPLMYWLMGISYLVFGFTAFAASLPSILSVIGCAVLLFLMGRDVAGTWAGTSAALVMSLCVGTFLFTRMVFPDILFVFFITLALYGFVRWYGRERNQSGWTWVLFYAGMAGAVLSKGLIGIVFPAGAVLLFLVHRRDLSCLGRFHLFIGTVIFLLLAAPWFMLAAYRIPGFLWYFFVNEHLLRFLGRRQPMDYYSIPVFTFWALVLVWLFPWSAFLPAAGQLLRGARERSRSANTVIWLSFSWIAVVLVFFTLSSRVEHYSLPIFPPIALLSGIVLAEEERYRLSRDTHQARWVGRGFGFLALIGALSGAAALTASFVWLHGRHPLLIGHIVGHHASAYSYYFAPVFDIPATILARLQFPLWLAAVSLSLGTVAAWWLNRCEWRRSAVVALAASMAVFCALAYRSVGVCETMISSRPFAGVLQDLWKPGDRLIVVGDYETANSLNFYTPAPLEVYGGRAAVLEWGLRYSDAPVRIVSKADFEASWNSDQRVFVLGPDSRIQELGLHGSCPLLHSGGRTLLCNAKGAKGSDRGKYL